MATDQASGRTEPIRVKRGDFVVSVNGGTPCQVLRTWMSKTWISADVSGTGKPVSGSRPMMAILDGRTEHFVPMTSPFWERYDPKAAHRKSKRAAKAASRARMEKPAGTPPHAAAKPRTAAAAVERGKNDADWARRVLAGR